MFYIYKWNLDRIFFRSFFLERYGFSITLTHVASFMIRLFSYLSVIKIDKKVIIIRFFSSVLNLFFSFFVSIFAVKWFGFVLFRLK